MTTDTLEDKAIGTFIGNIVGDALGTTLEFKHRDTYEHITDMVGGGPFNLVPGGWTDDSSMAIAIADAFLTDNEYNPQLIMQNFVVWRTNGRFSHNGRCFDIGNTTQYALTSYLSDPSTPYHGDAHKYSAGNGNIMRLGPVFTRYAHNQEEGTRIAVDQSRITHAHPLCLEYAKKCADFVYGEFNNKPVSLQEYVGKQRDEVSSSGFVKNTFEAACWAVSQTTNFHDALLLAVNLGGDADTVGAVTGIIAGARYGLSGIPQAWRKNICWSHKIHTMATELFRRSTLGQN